MKMLCPKGLFCRIMAYNDDINDDYGKYVDN
jgi:hypothetical protein